MEEALINNSLTIVSGPSRGGKSRWAEFLLRDKKSVSYIATLINDPKDNLLHERIKQHRERRPKHWKLVEVNQNLTNILGSLKVNEAVIIDSLGGFVAAHLGLAEPEWISISEEFITLVSNRTELTVIVIEETGWGVIPSFQQGIIFRDRQGLLAQRLDLIAKNAWLVIQGRALNLKELACRVP